MKSKKIFILLMIIIMLSVINVALAHPGGLDANGGHYVRTPGWGYPVGSYHYHTGASQSSDYSITNSEHATNTEESNNYIFWLILGVGIIIYYIYKGYKGEDDKE